MRKLRMHQEILKEIRGYPAGKQFTSSTLAQQFGHSAPEVGASLRKLAARGLLSTIYRGNQSNVWERV